MTGLLRSATFRRWSWLVIAALAVVALVRLTVEDGEPRTPAEQVRAIALTVKCPTCRSQSVADSDSAAARAIRTEITRRVEQGESPDAIRGAIADTYGDDVLLTPRSGGVDGIVWFLPVAALVAALGALGAVFARWRRQPSVTASEDDRRLVEQARAERTAAEP